MSEQAAPITRKQMDALVEGHCRAEERGDLEAIVDGFSPDAEHDVVGRPGDPLRGGDQIKAFCRHLFSDLRIDRLDAGTGTTTSSTSRPCTQPRSVGLSGSRDAGARSERAFCTSLISAAA
jgi:SnoaL-like domain